MPTATSTIAGYAVACLSCDEMFSCQSMYSTSWRSAYQLTARFAGANRSDIQLRERFRMLGQRRRKALALIGDGVADLADDLAADASTGGDSTTSSSVSRIGMPTSNEPATYSRNASRSFRSTLPSVRARA